MGYVVETAGRVLLPLDREAAAFEALKAAMAQRPGWFDADEVDGPVESLSDLASYAAASLNRAGDWCVFDTDEEGDPKWSEQATAFYAELASWVDVGTVTFTGEDDLEWSYTFSSDGLTQTGTNGWDGSTEPFGDPVDEEPVVAPPKRRAWWRRA